MTALHDRFQGLAVPSDGSYSGFHLGFNNYVIARDQAGRPALFVRHTAAPRRQNLTYSLENLEAILQYDAVVTTEDERISATFALIRCSSDDELIQRYFFELCDVLQNLMGPMPTGEQIEESINAFVRMFSLRENPAKKSAVGLIGELLFMEQHENTIDCINAWHRTPRDPIDFIFTTNSVEVKCTTTANRVHRVTAEQVRGLPGRASYFLSIQVLPTDSGMTGVQLLHQVVERCGEDLSAAIRIWEMTTETLGSNIQDFMEFAFDYHAAVMSMQFYNASDIPAVRGDLPPGVSRLEFMSDFSLGPQLEGGRRTAILS